MIYAAGLLAAALLTSCLVALVAWLPSRVAGEVN